MLLHDFARNRSEAAFAELVRRHLDLVHSAALRMTRDPHLAKDVSQGVFVALAKQAGKLTAHPALTSWLHQTARNIAAQTIRTETRRRHREHQAAAMNERSATGAPWEEIAPHLDAALGALPAPDRDAVLLRYFKNQSANDMAATLGISAEAAQKRVVRAVEKLRCLLTKRVAPAGVIELGSVLSANAVQAAPAGLASSISPSAIAVLSTSTRVMVLNTLRKLALGTAATAALVTAIHQTIRVSELRERSQALKQVLAAYPADSGSQSLPSKQAGDASHARTEVARKPPASATSALVMASIGGPTEPEDFSLFAPAGRGITTGAAEFAGLDPSQRKAVDKVLRSHWKRMEQDFASRAVEVPAKAAGSKGFSIPARGDGGSGPRARLEADLDAEVGAAKRVLLMRGLKPLDFFGGFGGLEIWMEFRGAGCDYRMTDPSSGKQLGTGSMSYDSFIDRFGTSFELPRPDGQPLIHR